MTPELFITRHNHLIDPAMHIWGWEIPLYLFLGGMVAGIMILAGIQIIMSRMIDSRKTFVIGISVIFGLSVDFAPGLYREVHPWIQPFFASSLSLATICAVLLNLFFRIGIAKTAILNLSPGVDPSSRKTNSMRRPPITPPAAFTASCACCMALR